MLCDLKSYSLYDLYNFRVEKNATGWSKDKLKELLVGMVIEDEECM